MVLRGRCRRVVARWVACVVAVGACMVGAGVPASVGDPLPTPSVPVAASPETPVLPGHVVTISVMVDPTIIKTPDGTYQWSIHMRMAFFGEKSQGEKFAQEECQFLADTFWSGSAPDYFVKVESRGVFCNLDAYYLGEARHAFYSLDEAGHVQVRAPMTYLTQIADSFEDASITELQVDFTSINYAHCNAEPWLAHLDDLLVVSHRSYCQWRPDKGDTVPTTDEPLLEGDAEQAFFDFERGTVGPFIDMPAPINPFTITPTPPQAEEPASGAATEAAASESSSASSRGLIIAVGAGAMLLLLAVAVGITWARRRTS